MTTLRSEDWSVRPSFVPHGPTSPVTLLADESGLTQLAGIPPVAWQTPWSELSNLELVRFSHQMALFGTVGAVRYCWRQRSLHDFEEVRVLVLEHGGSVVRRRRRAGVVVVVAVVLLASLAGGIAAWVSRPNLNSQELTDVKAVNLTLKDLPTSWYMASGSVLSYLTGTSNKVYTSTTIAQTPAKNSPFVKAAALFQSCLGVTNKNDRVYGAAGQEADYQVSSPIFDTNALGGIELISSTQYYKTTAMVRRDTKEMSMKNFGSCFTTSSANLILYATGVTASDHATSTNWRPTTFLKGWTRGGEVPLAVGGITAKLDLVEAVITHGHYEITMDALVGSFSKAKSFLSGIVNTLLSRTTTSTSQAA
ncbi:MAG TPA: hypothetical protein VND89_05835 [Acidimicrobiales bacterium]|nr:hypothetical protein [Acidimicrobiales bacterium]